MIRLFQVSIPTGIVLLVGGDSVLLALAYFFGAYFGLDPSTPLLFYMNYENGWLQLACVVGVVQIGLYLNDWYESALPASRMVLLQELCLVMGTAFLLQALLGYGQWELLQLPQWSMLYGSGLVLVILPIWRTIFYHLMPKALPSKKVLFWGASPAMLDIVNKLMARPDFGYVFLGYLDDKPAPALAESYYLGPRSTSVLDQTITDLSPNCFVISAGEESLTADPSSGVIQKLLELRLKNQMQVIDVEPLYESVLGRVSMRNLRPSTTFQSREWGIRLQTWYSFVLGSIGLVICLPVMIVVALLVRLTSRGPVLFRQTRVGFGGKLFELYKFRSMYQDAEAATGPVWATKDDPRITPLGRWLRKLRLDELPQFFNVVRGDMVLVGPRPERPEFCEILEKHLPFFGLRHMVKPGITGWAQINHAYADTIEDTAIKLEYDLYYIRHVAPSLDAYIIFHTIKVMLLSRGAQ